MTFMRDKRYTTPPVKVKQRARPQKWIIATRGRAKSGLRLAPAKTAENRTARSQGESFGAWGSSFWSAATRRRFQSGLVRPHSKKAGAKTQPRRKCGQ